MGLRGIGAFISGGMQGYEFGMRLEDRKDDKARQKKIDEMYAEDRARRHRAEDTNAAWTAENRDYTRGERSRAAADREYVEGTYAEADRRTKEARTADQTAPRGLAPAEDQPSPAGAELIEDVIVAGQTAQAPQSAATAERPQRGLRRRAPIKIKRDGQPGPTGERTSRLATMGAPDHIIEMAEHADRIQSASQPGAGNQNIMRNDAELAAADVAAIDAEIEKWVQTQAQPSAPPQAAPLRNPGTRWTQLVPGPATQGDPLSNEVRDRAHTRGLTVPPTAPTQPQVVAAPTGQAVPPNTNTALNLDPRSNAGRAYPFNRGSATDQSGKMSPDYGGAGPQPAPAPRGMARAAGADSPAEIAAVTDPAISGRGDPVRANAPAPGTPPPTGPAAGAATLPSTNTGAAAIADTPRPRGTSPKARASHADNVAKTYTDYYREHGAPYVVEQLMAKGMVSEAQEFETWMDTKKVKAGMDAYGRAMAHANMGDIEGFGGAIMDLYNNSGYFDDGLVIVPSGSEFSRDENGQIDGATITFEDEDGDVRVKTWETVDELINESLELLAPERAFEYRLQRMEAAKGVRASGAEREMDFEDWLRKEMVKASMKTDDTKKVEEAMKLLSKDPQWLGFSRDEKMAALMEHLQFMEQATSSQSGTAPSSGEVPAPLRRQ